MRRTALALASFCAFGAHAGGMVVRSEYAASQSLIQAASSGSNSTFTRLVNQSYKVGMSDLVRFPGPGGAAIEGRLALALTEKGALSVAARALALAGPAGVTAMGLYTLYEVYDAIRTRADGQGGLAFDPGAAPGMEAQYCYPAGAFYGVPVRAGCAGSPLAAGAAIVAPHPYGTRNLQCGQSACTFEAASPPTYYYGTWITEWYPATWHLNKTVMPICPATPTQPKGYYSPGFDGNCVSEQYTAPKTPDEAGDMRSGAAGQPGVPDIDYPKLMGDATKGYGPDGFPIPEDTGYEMPAPGITPSTIPGQTTTTTLPDGTIVEDTNEWRASTANSIGGPDGNRLVVPWNKTTTTKTTSPGGTTTTTTTSTGPSPGASGPGTGGTLNPADPCTDDPGRLGCIGLGTVTSSELPKQDAVVDVNPQAGWGAASGACPAPKTVMVAGRAVVIDNSIFCSFFAGIRWVLLGVAFLVAAKIVSGGVKD